MWGGWLFLLFAGLDDWRNIENQCEDNREDERFNNVIIESIVKLGMCDDGANEEVEERPDDKAGNEDCNEVN